MIGTIVLGFITGFGIRNRYKFTIAIGFCGACTTFSGWMLKVIELIFLGYFSSAFFNFCIVLLAGLLTFSVAFYFGRKTKRSIVHQ